MAMAGIDDMVMDANDAGRIVANLRDVTHAAMAGGEGGLPEGPDMRGRRKSVWQRHAR